MHEGELGGLFYRRHEAVAVNGDLRRAPRPPEPPSAGAKLAVDVVLAGDHHHHQPTRNGALSTEVPSDPPASPWIAAGDHRGSRAPTSFVPPPF